MSRGYLISIVLHVTIFLLVIINVNFLKKEKKMNYQKFSIHIGPIKKHPSKEKLLEKKDQKTKKVAPDITEKIEMTDIKDLKQKQDKRDIVIKKYNKIKEKIKKTSLKEKKQANKREGQKRSVKNLQQEKSKKIVKKNANNKEKLSSPIKKKKIEKQKTKEDFFLKKVENTSSVNLGNKTPSLNENNYSKIQEQLQKHWNKTPCLSDMLIEVGIIIDANCNIIHKSLKNNYSSSLQLKACAESALKAIQKVERLELSFKTCKKYSQELMEITFQSTY